MLGYKLIIEKFWSNNIFLPKASIILHRYTINSSTGYNNDYYYTLPTGKFNNYCFRLKLKIIKSKYHPKNTKSFK